MRRLIPRSLIGQIALVMALALLVAQVINFSLILTERQRFTAAQIEGPAINRFVFFAQRMEGLDPGQRDLFANPRSRRFRFSVDHASLLAPQGADQRLTHRLREVAAENGLQLADARAALGDAPSRRGRPMQMLVLSARLADGSWANARVVTPRPSLRPGLRLAAATLLIYLTVLAAMVWIAARLARPLRDLTGAAERFGGRAEPPYVEPRGPRDVRRAIEAFNAMGERVATMLDEKDRMLGAIGHDLRTPLASLRIRAETVEPEAEREKIVATIEEMTAMLDDTLALARSGRSGEQARAVDLCALADAVVEEFRAIGLDVELEGGEREIADVRPRLLRRAMRNLVENALDYAGSARVRVAGRGEAVAIEVLDRGPGIPEDELRRVQEPFYRLEGSRSRETGGSGLGLALARAAAQAHGGSLELENRPGGGLAARILVPRRRPQGPPG